MIRQIFQLLPDFPQSDDLQAWLVRFPVTKTIPAGELKPGTFADDYVIEGIAPPGPDLSKDYMLSLNGWPLVSDSLRDLIDQYFPGTAAFQRCIFSPEDQSYQSRKFFVMTALLRLDALDRDHQKVVDDDWTPRPNGTYKVCHPFHLRLRSIGDYPIFRVAGCPSPLFVNNIFKDLIIQNSLNGMRFDEDIYVH